MRNSKGGIRGQKNEERIGKDGLEKKKEQTGKRGN